MQALLFSAPIAPMLASTIRMSRASMISRSATSVGWLKKRRSGGTPVRPEILLRGASRRSATRLVARREVVGELGAEELGGLVEVGLVGAGLGDGGAEVVLGRAQQRVDVLELRRAASCLAGEGDRADDGVVEVAARGLEDLVGVDVQQRGDDVVGDRRGLRAPAGRSPGSAQRAHAERGSAEVQEPDALAAVGRREAQAQARELALGVDDDRSRRRSSRMSLR